LNPKNMKCITQVAIVVKDAEKAAALWSKILGLEKTKVEVTEGLESSHMTFRGKLSEGRAKLVFFSLGDLVLELIEPIGGPSTWQDFLDKHGEGIHHIAFQVENLEETLEKLSKIGIKVEQKGDFKEGCYVYTSPKKDLGAILELLYMHT